MYIFRLYNFSSVYAYLNKTFVPSKSPYPTFAHSTSKISTDSTPRYYMVVNGYYDTPLNRQITEAVTIKNTPYVINNKTEWASQGTVGVQLTCA